MLILIGCAPASGLHAADQAGSSTPRVGVLTLVNGNTIEGQLCASESSGRICWQGNDFVGPFEFRAGAIKSIKFPVQRERRNGESEFAFEFHHGDVITGRLAGWTEDTVRILSDQFGTMIVRADSIRRLHRIEENATMVFASLAGLQDWTTTQWDTSGWEEDGDHLWTREPGAILNGDLGVPVRAAVEFEISWTDRPDFVFAIGVDIEGQTDSHGDGWRFETVGSSLAVVREQDGKADVDLIADLSNQQRIRLHAFVDQQTGQMQVFVPDGPRVGQVEPRGDAGVKQEEGSTRGIRLINRGSGLRLERLRIAKWLGKAPVQPDAGQASVAMADGTFVSGTILRFDADAKQLVVGDADQQQAIALEDVIAVKFARVENSVPPPQCALFLHGGVRLSGNFDAVDETHWVMSGPNLERVVRVPRDRVRTMIVFNHGSLDTTDPEPPGRLGRLEIGSHKLTGRIAVAPKQGPTTAASTNDASTNDASTNDASPLRWHPFGSRTSSALKTASSGRIVYRDPPVVDNSSTAARALAMQRLRLQQQKRGLNFGQLFLRRADKARSSEVKRDAHVVHVRSGDVVACRVESIGEDGVYLSTVDSDRGFVAHHDVKAIELVSNSPPPDLEQVKRDRLLTLPRLQKSSPPSHLICSHNGDFLRCRLVKLDEQSVHIEVQLEELEIPRDRVAQIIWFHPDELRSQADEESDPAAAVVPESPFVGLAQVVKRDGKRVTFDPTEVTEQFVAGTSEVLGRCRFEISQVDQLIFGSRIAEEVSDLAYNQWRLHPAVEPIVTQNSGDGPTRGSESALIGRDAPEVQLELLGGGQFQLSQCEGQIVVLDFWASWCAPCMQTMPLVEKAIAPFDVDKVRLVSINLEEPAEHVLSVLERHGLSVPVALDIDGIAAQRYEARAIPQLVIVGADGKVHRLYVGGGSGVVEQMKAAITEMLDSPAS